MKLCRYTGHFFYMKTRPRRARAEPARRGTNDPPGQARRPGPVAGGGERPARDPPDTLRAMARTGPDTRRPCAKRNWNRPRPMRRRDGARRTRRPPRANAGGTATSAAKRSPPCLPWRVIRSPSCWFGRVNKEPVVCCAIVQQAEGSFTNCSLSQLPFIS